MAATTTAATADTNGKTSAIGGKIQIFPAVGWMAKSLYSTKGEDCGSILSTVIHMNRAGRRIQQNQKWFNFKSCALHSRLCRHLRIFASMGLVKKSVPQARHLPESLSGMGHTRGTHRLHNIREN
jgi:hypothetical protein